MSSARPNPQPTAVMATVAAAVASSKREMSERRIRITLPTES